MQDKEIRLRSVAKIVINRMVDEGVLNFDDEEATKGLEKTLRLINEQQALQDLSTRPAKQIGDKQNSFHAPSS